MNSGIEDKIERSLMEKTDPGRISSKNLTLLTTPTEPYSY